MWIRFIIYGLSGICMEVAWTALLNFASERDWRLRGESYLWMFPIYGLCAPLFEPVHDQIRDWPLLGRAVFWSLGITVIELVTGWLLERLTGRCPWDYVEAGARFAINPYIRWDYFPCWAIVGLVVERYHDVLVELTPAIRTAFAG